mmetsp:Transcript_71448/g.201609  ORF Transcript_71448/g.201609 Transcript_71448/m.201609 type:complete len:321 (+) Transcript_71448:193-1155(+)
MTTSRRRTAAAAARSTPLSGLSRPTTRAAMRALSPGGRASSASAAPTTKPTPARPLPAGQFAPAPPSHVSPHAHHRQARPPFSRCPPFRRARRRLHRDDRDANRSTVWAPSSSTRAGSDMAESRSFENLQRLASQLTNVQGRINTHIDMLLKQESDVFLDEWTIDRSHLKIGRELGRGMFGVIREARWRGTPVAIKMLHLDVNHYMDENSELFAKELTAMRQLHHPNIVQFLGLARLPEPGIVMELFPHGSVEDYVTKSRWLRYSTARRFACEMANALAYLHGRKPKMFIHRDIKPSKYVPVIHRRRPSHQGCPSHQASS